MLKQGILSAPGQIDPVFLAPGKQVTRSDIAATSPAAAVPPGASVLLSIYDAADLVRVLAALDGHVARMSLVSAAASAEVVTALGQAAEIDLIISDRTDLSETSLSPDETLTSGAAAETPAGLTTQWLMTTSGTTGTPKIVPHTVESLSRTVRRDPLGRAPIWGLILEMTRFAGLQVTLQALLGGGTLVAAPSSALSTPEQIAFLADHSVTHLSGTSTLWRRLLMAPGVEKLPLRQITLGGEIADQPVLDALGKRFPEARVTHIYASTEAGVGFAVNDRLAGFPLSYTEQAPGQVGVRIKDGMLWIRPPGNHVARYLGGQALDVDKQGYVNTGDRLDVQGDRALFLGRDTGAVNIGGVKVYPERVERLIATVPGVGLASVNAKSNPITGALLMATVVPTDQDADQDALKNSILSTCRESLEREAVPARVRFAESLETNAAGKILRR